MSNITKDVKPFGMVDKVGYMFGDFGNDFTFILSSTFLMKFYTDVMGVSPVIVGMMMMFARFVDAFTDVTMGQIADRSRPTAKGKFLPWIRRMCGPVALASFLMYAVWFKDMPMAFKIVWMFGTYLLWGSICYTGINIPYGSMASAISPEARDRSELSSWRTIGATLASMFIGVVLPMIVYYEDASGNTIISGTRMAIAGAVCSVFAIICYLLCYHLSTERVKIEKKEEKFNFIELLKTLFSSRALIGIVLAALLLLLAQLTLSAMGQYVFPNYFGSKEGVSISGFCANILIIILAFMVPTLAAKYGKKELSAFGGILGAVVFFIAFVLHTNNMYLFIALYTIGYMGVGFFNVNCWAMITDVIDDAEVRQGERSDGTFYSVYSFARKMGQAASSGLSGVLLGAVGYTASTAFEPEVLNGIYNISCLVPAAGFLLMALVLIFIYPLGKKKVDSNIACLKERREGK